MDDTTSTPSDVLNNYFSKVGTLWLSVLSDQQSERRFGTGGPAYTGKDLYLAIKNKEYTAEQAIESASTNINRIFAEIAAAEIDIPKAT